MTPDVQAAAERLRTFLDDIDTCFRAAGADPEAHRNAPVIIAPGYDLTIGDLHTLLAAINPPCGAPFIIANGPACTRPANHGGLHESDRGDRWIGAEAAIAHGGYDHADAPIDRVPTPRGRRLVADYRDARTRQHPKAET